MLKKRLIFTLLYDSGYFMLSRNFRLQRVGDISWLKNNYNFSEISGSIDELIVIDVTRGKRNLNTFSENLSILAKECFVPIAAGGGINELESARLLFRSGADKVIVNSKLFEDDGFIENLASEFGKQSIIASIDFGRSNDEIKLFSNNGTHAVQGEIQVLLRKTLSRPIGEIFINSIHRDGTGQGLDLELLDILPKQLENPLILAGGVGNAKHIIEGLKLDTIDAVATANLFNFIGDGLSMAREQIIKSGISLPNFSIESHR